MSERKFITYSQEFKEDAARQYLQGGKSYLQLTEELGIKDAKTLRSWVSKVRNGESLEEGRGKAKGARRGRPKTNFSSVEEELAYVKSERDFFKALCKAKLGHDWEEEKKNSLQNSGCPSLKASSFVATSSRRRLQVWLLQMEQTYSIVLRYLLAFIYSINSFDTALLWVSQDDSSSLSRRLSSKSQASLSAYESGKDTGSYP